MPKMWESKYARDNYHSQLGYLIDFGEPVEVRGRQTQEILNAITAVTEPWHHCILLPDRRWNPWLALSEFLWIMAGRDDIATLEPYNSHIKDFSDDGETLYGAYGVRIFEQIDPMIKRIQNDPSDRRAVLDIWDSDTRVDLMNSDLTADTKDPPCNTQIMFKLRDNKLHMTVINRSNDIHWGLYAVNLPTFSMLQVYIAARLGVPVGTQTHLSNSLHVYTDDERANAITERMFYKTEETKPPYPKHSLIFDHDEVGNANHEQFAEMCNATLEGLSKNSKPGENVTTFHTFADDFLRVYRDKSWNDLSWMADHWSMYQDWVMAGYMFIEQTGMKK